MDGRIVKTPWDVPVVPEDPEVPLPDVPVADEPVPLDAVKTGIVPKGLLKPLTKGCVIPPGVMPKAPTGD
jgi:hypothetical protein